MALHYSNTLSYDMNGRKRKAQKVTGDTYKRLKAREGTAPMPDYNHRSSGQVYKSAADAPLRVDHPVDNSYKVEVSKNYTVAPAYNKGAYQVIGKDNIEHIGK